MTKPTNTTPDPELFYPEQQPGENVRGETPACPTGLSTDSTEADETQDHQPLEVERLEGRQGADEEE